jgi:hypothetical protein
MGNKLWCSNVPLQAAGLTFRNVCIATGIASGVSKKILENFFSLILTPEIRHHFCAALVAGFFLFLANLQSTSGAISKYVVRKHLCGVIIQ